jgi:hypothetical protein
VPLESWVGGDEGVGPGGVEPEAAGGRDGGRGDTRV